MSCSCRTALVAALLVLQASSLAAQVVSGAVTNAGTGAPVPGVLISAFPERGDTLALGLTDSTGNYRVRLPATAARVTLLFRAIGLRPVTVALSPAAATADTIVSVTMRPVDFRLAAVEVVERTSCGATETGTHNVVDVWTEVTNALRSSLATRDLLQRHFEYIAYERVVDMTSGALLAEQVDTTTSLTTCPFKAIDPAQVARDGYVTDALGDMRRAVTRFSSLGGAGHSFDEIMQNLRTLVFVAPDEAVLLEAAFQTDHCFWASEGSGLRSGLVGLHFMPVDGITRNDIRGTFWIDTASYELRQIEYNYTRWTSAPSARDRALIERVDTSLYERPAQEPARALQRYLQPGGEITYRRVGDGTFLVVAWRIWATDSWQRTGIRGRPLPFPAQLRQGGGAVLRIIAGGWD